MNELTINELTQIEQALRSRCRHVTRLFLEFPQPVKDFSYGVKRISEMKSAILKISRLRGTA